MRLATGTKAHQCSMTTLGPPWPSCPCRFSFLSSIGLPSSWASSALRFVPRRPAVNTRGVSSQQCFNQSKVFKHLEIGDNANASVMQPANVFTETCSIYSVCTQITSAFPWCRRKSPVFDDIPWSCKRVLVSNSFFFLGFKPGDKQCLHGVLAPPAGRGRSNCFYLSLVPSPTSAGRKLFLHSAFLIHIIQGSILPVSNVGIHVVAIISSLRVIPLLIFVIFIIHLLLIVVFISCVS